MKIVEYDDADPVGILHLNLLSLGWRLTPELAARIRRLDPRPLPCFAVYAIEDGVVAGQVGVYRLPMVSVNGRKTWAGWARCAPIRPSVGEGLRLVCWRRLMPECGRAA